MLYVQINFVNFSFNLQNNKTMTCCFRFATSELLEEKFMNFYLTDFSTLSRSYFKN